MGLSVRQKTFCNEYLVDLNATRAAIAAGYSEKTARSKASQLLTKVNIQTYIKEQMDAKDAQLIAKQDEVLQYLTAVMRRQKKENVVVTISNTIEKYLPDEQGTMRKQKITKADTKVVEIPARLVDANKAAELLGKRYGLFNDRIDVSGAVPVIITGEEDIED